MEALVRREFAGEIEALEEIPRQCHFVHHKSHMT
jgi:hypothetical protein